jgi:hypothetical protein
MAPISDAIAAEVKGLKAAYKQAIGATRKGPKGGRKKKNESQLDLEAPLNPNLVVDAPEAIDGVTTVEDVQSIAGNQHSMLLVAVGEFLCVD